MFGYKKNCLEKAYFLENLIYLFNQKISEFQNYIKLVFQKNFPCTYLHLDNAKFLMLPPNCSQEVYFGLYPAYVGLVLRRVDQNYHSNQAEDYHCMHGCHGFTPGGTALNAACGYHFVVFQVADYSIHSLNTWISIAGLEL